MQRLTLLRIDAGRLQRAVDLYSRHSTQQVVWNINQWTSKRCLSSASKKNNDKKETDTHADLYRPSTAKTETHVPDDLKGGQAIETVAKPPPATLTGGGKVWSVQNPGSVHVAPLGAATTTFVPTSTEPGQPRHETTVHSTHGPLNIANPLTTHTLQPEVTPGQLAEAAAASAFETFAPNTSSAPTDATFAPKISSTDVYSRTSSPTSNFENVMPAAAEHEAQIYEKHSRSTVFGGQDTSASSKKHPTEDLFGTKPATEIPIHRESDIRDEILREALKFVDERGWTMDAIRAGITASNQPSTIEGLFSNGYDLVEYFIRDANAKMSTYMNEKAKNDNVQGTRLLIEGLKYRLGLVVPYARTWDQALAQGALPQNAMRGWKTLLDLSSNAWHGIGDTSTDINWYTKRLILAAIYKSSEIFMLQDQSPDKTETMQFLERRLGDFQTMGTMRNSVSKSLSDTAQIAGGLLSVVRNMTSRR